MAIRQPEDPLTSTALFVDLCGYTSLCERVAAEDVKLLIDDYVRIFCEHTTAGQGYVVECQGDGCLAWFPGGKQGAERAAAAALEICKEVRRLREPEGKPLSASAGIESGVIVRRDAEITSGEVVSARGLAFQQAMKIKELASPQQVIAGPAAYELIRNAYRLRRVTDVVKGETVFGFLLLGKKQRR